MTISLFSAANSNFSSSDARSSNSDFLDLFQLARKEKLDCSQLQRTFKRIRRGVALGAVLVMFQGSSAALTSAWADGCVDNPTYCVVSTADASIVNEGEHTLRSAVATANLSGASSSTIGFADQLFGIVRDSSGTVTSSTNNYQNPVVITLDSTLEIRTNLAIKAPTAAFGSNILTIERGTGVVAGDPLISVNSPSLQTGPVVNGATVQVRIENVTIDSNANPNTGNLNAPKATSGVTIQVSPTEVTTENGPTLVTPEVVLKSTQVLNAVSESGGAAVNTSGDVRIENSTLVGNMAVSSGDGTASDGGAIKAEGTVTVVSSALNGNSATGDGGAISATTVNVSNAEDLSNSRFYGNTAGGGGGAINSLGDTVISGAALDENVAGGIKNQSVENPAAQPTATVTGGNGGAVNAGGAVMVSGSQLAGNNSFTGTEVNSQSGNGGAISAGAQVAITDSNIEGNKAGMNGGAISAGGEVLVETISNPSPSSISSNQALLGSGGAISSGATVTVTNTVLHGNSAGTDGGAISSASNVVGTDTHLAGNTANTNGGAISAGGSVSVTTTAGARNSSLSSNQAISGSGGAIDAGVSVYAQNVDMSGNRAGSGGGAIRAAGEVGITTFDGTASSALSGNRAGGDGGAVLAGGDVSVNATQMFGNSAGRINNQSLENPAAQPTATAFGGNGGAVNAGGAVVVSGSELAGNQALTGTEVNSQSGNGGAINAGAQVAITDSKVGGNTAGMNGGAISAGTTVIISDSELSGNLAGYSAAANSISGLGGNGGAINAQLDVTVTNNSILSSNAAYGGQAPGTQPGEGGAINARDGVVTITDSTLKLNQADGDGGAVNTDSAVIRSSTFAGNGSNYGSGGAIYAEGSATITDSNFINDEETDSTSNYAFGNGGAIYAKDITIDLSLFQGNGARVGGAIYSYDITSDVIVANSEFLDNSTMGDGGAIYAEGKVTVSDSRFGTEIDVHEETPFIVSIQGNRAFMGQGGAIYSESDVQIARSIFGGNISGVGGGAIASEGATSVNASLFFLNQALGNGGAIESNGTVSIENGSLIVANQAGTVNFSGWEFLFPSFYPIFGPGEMFVAPQYGGNGGAIYSHDSVIVRGSSIGTLPPIWAPDASVFSNKALCSGYWSDESVDRYWIQECGFSREDGMWISLGNGGGIYAAGKVTIEGSETEYEFNLQTFSFNSKESSFESSYLTNNYAQNRGGAVYASGGVQVDDAVFGSTSEINPNYNPSREYINYIEAGGEEFFYVLDDPTKIQDDYKFNYLGNRSGNDGGAIYVEGSTFITNSSFSGNTSGDEGGAIYSEGALEIKNSTFSRNWAEDDGGAIKTNPGDGDLLIARTAFIENLAMDDGGAIDISTDAQPHYDDLILSSLFRDNEAFGPGGAIDSSFVILILNTFENNDSPDGHALHLHGGILSGNKLIGTTSSSFQSSLDLCSRSVYTEFNFTTDESCFAGQEDEFISVDNVLLSHAQMAEPAAALSLPPNYAGTLLENFKELPEFYLEAPSESNPAGILSEFGSFITNELNKDFKSAIRDSSVLWNPGHIQSIFPNSIETPEVDNPVVNEGTDDQVVVVPPSSNNQDSPILILGPVLSTEELARLAAQRAEQMAAELKRQQEAERAAAERLAKIKADKLARDKARALAAEKRRAQLAALKAKIAATQARGDALKRKPSWINLMKNSSAQKAVKKLVVSPAK